MNCLLYALEDSLSIDVFLIKTLMNVDQLYSCLLKLKLNFCIGPNGDFSPNRTLISTS